MSDTDKPVSYYGQIPWTGKIPWTVILDPRQPKGVVTLIDARHFTVVAEIFNLWYPDRPLSGELPVHLL
jgi:hypothetical protein